MTFVREEILWEKINEGDEKELSVGPITRPDLVKNAGASGDFNPNHHEEIYSIRSGIDKPFAHGMLQGGILSRLITDWFGVGTLRYFRLRFSAQTWPGDTINCKAKIIKKIEEENSIEIEAEATNANNVLLIKALAKVEIKK